MEDDDQIRIPSSVVTLVGRLVIENELLRNTPPPQPREVE